MLFFFNILYNASFALFNLQLYLRFYEKAFSTNWLPYDRSIKILVLSLIGITVGKAIALLFCEIREVCKNLVCRNRVQDDGKDETTSEARRELKAKGEGLDNKDLSK